MKTLASRPMHLDNKPAYLEMVKGYGRKWMLSTLHMRGLKEGKKFRTDDELAEALYDFANLHRAN